MKEKIAKFVEALNKKYPQDADKIKYAFMAVSGRKYTKIANTRDGITPVSSYGFIDNETGDVFKAASWAAPAKGARGNINNETGLACCGEYSVAYKN